MDAFHEFDLIHKIKEKLGDTSSSTDVGIGDDTAVLNPPLGKMLATVDALVENVHFSFDSFSFEEVGHKALAVNLSDIASKGGKPLYALVSLGIRPGISEEEILKFYEGMACLAKKYHVDIVGGNCTRASQFFADVTLIGETEKPILRSGAREGDLVGVTGVLGAAASGLAVLEKRLSQQDYSALIEKQKKPLPRLKEGLQFSQLSGVHASIDISDGLSSELFHLRASSEVGFFIDESKLPLHPETLKLAKELSLNPYEWAWNGGEDYELLITFSPEEEFQLRALVTVIGKVTSFESGMRVKRGLQEDNLEPKGWKHF